MADVDRAVLLDTPMPSCQPVDADVWPLVDQLSEFPVDVLSCALEIARKKRSSGAEGISNKGHVVLKRRMICGVPHKRTIRVETSWVEDLSEPFRRPSTAPSSSHDA